MTGLEIGLILFVFVFQTFWMVCLYIRHGQLTQKLEAFERALNKQVELNESVQNAFVVLGASVQDGFATMNTANNDRFAALAERLNIEGWRD